MRARDLLPIFLIAAVSAAGCGHSAQTTATLTTKAVQAHAQLYSHAYSDGIGVHTTQRVTYATNPPTNGPHYPQWAADGDYAGVTPPRTEMIVHAQEHGRVVYWYAPSLPKAQRDQLEALFEKDPYHVLLVENRTDMNCPVAVTAWGHGMRCPRWEGAATLAALSAFRDTYRDHGPEVVM